MNTTVKELLGLHPEVFQIYSFEKECQVENTWLVEKAIKAEQAGEEVYVVVAREWSNHDNRNSAFETASHCGNCSGRGCDEGDLYEGSPECRKQTVKSLWIGEENPVVITCE